MIISPSGRFYGSEQVLFDYLSATKQVANVYVPNEGVFKDRLKALETTHRICLYNSSSVPFFYLRVFFWLLTGRYKTVYCNEAGHSKYMSLLAALFRSKHFFIHARLNEDAAPHRWRKKNPPNLTVFAISKFIQEQLPFRSLLIYDPYPFKTQYKVKPAAEQGFRIGVIGRLSVSKGFDQLIDLLKAGKMKECVYDYLLFGEADEELQKNGSLAKLDQFPNVKQMGYCVNKEDMYCSIDCVLHLSSNEPLGRIFLEAIDFERPLIGFHAGGIGEIGELTGLTELLVDPGEKDIPAALFNKIELVRQNKERFIHAVRTSKEKAKEIFNIGYYSTTMDTHLNGNTGI